MGVNLFQYKTEGLNQKKLKLMAFQAKKLIFE